MAGNRMTAGDSAMTHSIPPRGWNLISFPYTPVRLPKVTDVFGRHIGICHVLSYRNGEWATADFERGRPLAVEP